METMGIELETLLNTKCLVVIRGENQPIEGRYGFDHTLVSVEQFGVFFTSPGAQGVIRFVPWQNIDRILFNQDLARLRKTA